MGIVTSYWAKPIPDRSFDWEAHSDQYEGGDPIGHGATEAEAIADYEAILDDLRVEEAANPRPAPEPLPPHIHGFNVAFASLIDMFAKAGGWDEETR